MRVRIEFTIPDVILGKNMFLEAIWTCFKQVFILSGVSDYSMERL